GTTTPIPSSTRRARGRPRPASRAPFPTTSRASGWSGSSPWCAVWRAARTSGSSARRTKCWSRVRRSAATCCKGARAPTRSRCFRGLTRGSGPIGACASRAPRARRSPPGRWSRRGSSPAWGDERDVGSGAAGLREGARPVPPVLRLRHLSRRRAAIGIMGGAGVRWGGATLRERAATCEGRWQAAEEGARAAIVRLSDPAPDSGGPVAADVVAGACGGALRLRWPDGIPAAGGTTWVVAGRWVGSYDRGVLVVRRAKLLDGEPRGRGALRGRLAARSAALFGRRAPLVDALVFAQRSPTPRIA